LYAGDPDGVARLFHADAEYTDVGSPADDVARGPAQVAARLRLALDGVTLSHTPRHVVATGDVVMTEHVEHWQFKTGERVDLPIASVHVLRDGRIERWTDYWDLATLLNAAPPWWIEQVSRGYLQP
jgi:ketosteroid isomerase-like protein